MTPEHLDLLITARSHLAALADTAPVEADYEDILLDLSELHPSCPATPIVPTRPNRAACYRRARRAVWGLRSHGVHELSLALLVARLDGAWDAERHAARGAP